MKTSNQKYATRIESVADIADASLFKRSVIIPNHETMNKPKPAAFIRQLDDDTLCALIELGMYLYEPKAKHVIYAQRLSMACRFLGWIKKKFAKK